MKEEDLSPVDKICVICFDEMKVAYTYEYDPTTDSVQIMFKLWPLEV